VKVILAKQNKLSMFFLFLDQVYLSNDLTLFKGKVVQYMGQSQFLPQKGEASCVTIAIRLAPLEIITINGIACLSTSYL